MTRQRWKAANGTRNVPPHGAVAFSLGGPRAESGGQRMGSPRVSTASPGCLRKGRCAFASDFKLMGKHSIRACVACGRVFDNGKEKGPLAVHPKGV
jgi:hypothetical protein